VQNLTQVTQPSSSRNHRKITASKSNQNKNYNSFDLDAAIKTYKNGEKNCKKKVHKESNSMGQRA